MNLFWIGDVLGIRGLLRGFLKRLLRDLEYGWTALKGDKV